jgi:hypothetical protein
MTVVISKIGSKKLLKVISARAKKLVSDPKFKARMASINSIPIIKKYDIPYLAGYSVDGKTVYIDRHLKTEWKGEDLSKFLRLHEITEKTLLDIGGLTYQEAHHIATHYERMAVEKAGLNWNEYTKYLDPFIKKVHHEHLDIVPKNLDLTPYKDEHEKKLLTNLMAKEKSVNKTVKKTIGINEVKISLKYHKELNPKLWNGFELKPEVREKLLKFADVWAKFARIPLDFIEDVIIIGGNVNYNYTAKSDIDVHVIIDRDKLGPNREMIDDYLQDKKVLWTLTHKISVLGYDIEPYAQDSHASYPRGQGVYSIKRNTWVQYPPRGEYDFANDTALKKKVIFYKRLIDTVINDKMDLDAVQDIKKKLREMRAASIAKGGEFGFENLVFKELRNRGYLDKINKYEKSVREKELSL